jgi:hypothetical protein
MPKDVLKNTDNEIEFAGVFRPPKRSTKEAIKLFLYNSEAGTVLGRTGVSWGKDVLWFFVTCSIFIRFCYGTQELLNSFEEHVLT